MARTTINPMAIDAYIPIESIVVLGRHRKNLGDLDSLADSILDVGLLNPVTVTPDNRLVAGQRRVEACRLLGWDSIPARVVGNLDEASRLLHAERDENTCRKDMAPSELVSLGAALELLERPKNDSRLAAGRSNGGKARHEASSAQGPRAELERDRATETAAVVGEALGIGRARYYQAKQIVRLAGDEAQHPDVRQAALEAQREMDETGKITTAYEGVKKALRRDRARAETAEVVAAALAAPVEPDELDPLPVEAGLPSSLKDKSSRIAVIRKRAGEGCSSRQISAEIGVRDDWVRKLARENGIHIGADDVMARTRKIDSNRVVRETVYALDGLAMGVQLVNFDNLDPAECVGWVSSMTDSLRVLNRFVKQLKEKTP